MAERKKTAKRPRKKKGRETGEPREKKPERKEFMAQVLVEAVYTTDADVMRRYGVSERSLQRWRRMLADGDPVLAGFVATKRAALDKEWAQTLPVALTQSVETVGAMMIAIRNDPTFGANPLALEKVAGAMKLLADVYFTGKIIDARVSPTDRPKAGLLGSGDAAEDDAPDYPN
jgi:hypothetical protein